VDLDPRAAVRDAVNKPRAAFATANPIERVRSVDDARRRANANLGSAE